MWSFLEHSSDTIATVVLTINSFLARSSDQTKRRKLVSLFSGKLQNEKFDRRSELCCTRLQVKSISVVEKNRQVNLLSPSRFEPQSPNLCVEDCLSCENARSKIESRKRFSNFCCSNYRMPQRMVEGLLFAVSPGIQTSSKQRFCLPGSVPW